MCEAWLRAAHRPAGEAPPRRSYLLAWETRLESRNLTDCTGEALVGLTPAKHSRGNRVQPRKGSQLLPDTAATLFDRLLKKEISLAEFLQLTDHLADEELEELLVLLFQRAAEEQKVKSASQT